MSKPGRSLPRRACSLTFEDNLRKKRGCRGNGKWMEIDAVYADLNFILGEGEKWIVEGRILEVAADIRNSKEK